MKTYTAFLYDHRGHRTGKQRLVQATNMFEVLIALQPMHTGTIEFRGPDDIEARVYTPKGHWQIREREALLIAP